ncbi:MAG TPA: hypothetical protein VFU48_10680 [Nitrospira sp.]|nr:hypothetical protein [Nitrospira sp.]
MEPVDLSRVQLRSLGQRVNKVALAGMARPHQPGQSFADFLASLPSLMLVEDLRAVVAAIGKARRNNRPVIVGMGGHVIKCGLGPILIDLLERKIVTALAFNGSAAIHDFEIALIGATSEDVAQGLQDGSFGMVRETGEGMNRAINRVQEHPAKGMGTLLGEYLNRTDVPCRPYSVLAAAQRLSVPLTVHVAIGCDIIHMHPSADGAALGLASFNDFKLFCGVVSELTGGVYVNIGSAVLMPEVFLKAFSVAQNLGRNLHDFVTVNMDMLGHYRPGENVVRRPASVGGRGYTLLGRHEVLVPLLAASLIETFS